MEKKEVQRCQLGRNMPGPPGSECAPDVCRRCGWNPKVEKWRKALIHAGVLERDENGVERLVLKN